MTESKALEVLHDTITKAPKNSGMSPNSAWLADVYGFNPFSKDEDSRPLAPDQAMKLMAFLICIDVISQDIAKVGLQLRRRIRGGGSEIVDPKDHWLAGMLAMEPNEYHTWYEFNLMIMLHLCVVSNAFVAKDQTISGEVKSLIPILPGNVRILVDDDQYLYEISSRTPSQKLEQRRLDAVLVQDEMIHLRGRMLEGPFGYSNLEAGSGVMGLSQALQRYQTRLYSNDAAVRGVFQMKNEETLSADAFARLKRQLADRWHNRNSDPIVLEEGMEFESASMNASEAEVAKNKASAVEDMARLFRVPPHKMMHIVNVKYENMETLEKSYVKDTLIPIAVNFEQRMARQLLSPKERLELFLMFDREAMELTDVEKQEKIYKTMVMNGAMTIDELRMKRNLNPLPDGAGAIRLLPSTHRVVPKDSNEPIIDVGNSDAGPQADDDDQDDDNTDDNADDKKLADVVELHSVK